MFQSFNSTKVARFGHGAVILRSRNNEALTEEQLRDAAPSIFADIVRYGFLPAKCRN